MDSGKAFDDGPKSMPQLETEILFSLAFVFHLSRGEPCIDVDLPHIPKEALNYPFAEYPSSSSPQGSYACLNALKP